MPELPEVETIKRDLQTMVGFKISQFIVRHTSLLRGSKALFSRALVGSKIMSLDRRAKVLVINLSSGYSVFIHLKMTGQLVLVLPQGKYKMGGHPIVGLSKVPNKFTHIELHFFNRAKLYFNDVRRFGYWQIIKTSEVPGFLKKYGPEPLQAEFTLVGFKNNLQRRLRTNLKAALLDQSILAGLGNIYVDESLFKAGLKPSRLVKSLNNSDYKKLWQAIKYILSKAVKARGTSFDSYVDGRGRQGTYWVSRLVYGRTGQLCKRCKNAIIKITLAGRGTHYCAHCQK